MYKEVGRMVQSRSVNGRGAVSGVRRDIGRRRGDIRRPAHFFAPIVGQKF